MTNTSPTPDRQACNTFWQSYLASLPADHPHRDASPDAFAFCGGGPVADELADLVLAGTKRATTSLAVEFTVLDERRPREGDLSIILGSDFRPVAIIERSRVEMVPFEDVTEEFAATEGEGDGSLGHWRRVHRDYFESVIRQLGGEFDARTPVICQVFRLLWPRRAGESG